MTTPDTSAETQRTGASLPDDVESHLGIRFAEIAHRFAPPTHSRTFTQVSPGSGYGPSPMQPPVPWLPPDLTFSEDCLNLNLWSPRERPGPHPVVVWLYGGGFEGGSNALPQTRGSYLAGQRGLVVVALNYRVGALGFSYLADRGEAFNHAGNLGVQDVIAGLNWVKENVHRVGGDPANVTVVGESAGGFIAAALAAAPAAEGLFHRLALFSGGASRLIPLEQGNKQAASLIAALPEGDWRQSLLEGPADSILAAQRAFISEDIGIRNAAVPQALGIVLDAGTPNAVLAKHPMEAFGSGELNGIPVLVSSTQDEIALFRGADPGRFDPESHEALKAEMREWGIPEGRIAGLHRHYSVEGTLRPGVAKERMLTDWIYRLPAARLAQAHAQAGGSAYLALVAGVDGMPAGHACEVNAIFGVPGAVETAGETARRTAITDAVVAFATSGQPGWPSVTADDLHAFSFGDGSFDATSDYSLLLDLWDGITRP